MTVLLLRSVGSYIEFESEREVELAKKALAEIEIPLGWREEIEKYIRAFRSDVS
jgi:hypothetical protein